MHDSYVTGNGTGRGIYTLGDSPYECFVELHCTCPVVLNRNVGIYTYMAWSGYSHRRAPDEQDSTGENQSFIRSVFSFLGGKSTQQQKMAAQPDQQRRVTSQQTSKNYPPNLHKSFNLHEMGPEKDIDHCWEQLDHPDKVSWSKCRYSKRFNKLELYSRSIVMIAPLHCFSKHANFSSIPNKGERLHGVTQVGVIS